MSMTIPPLSGATPAYPRMQKPDPSPERRDDSAESVTVDTGRVDRELERLRQKKAELEQRLARAAGPERVRLEKELAGVAEELRSKDTDAYRRRNSDVH